MHPIRATLKHVARAVLYTALGGVVVGGWFYVSIAQRQADLQVWHTVDLESEYRGPGDDRVEDFDDYLALEDALFAELMREVYDSPDAPPPTRWSRYTRGGPQDPSRSDHAWNRSTILEHDAPVGGALMLHGATDSPYSMRGLAERLHAAGWYVVAPRYPGHGTAPVGLDEFDWRDLAEVVRMSARHLRERIGPDAPLVVVGYSTGCALAADHALARLEGEDREAFDAMVMLSPAMGVSSLAAFAKTQGRVARIIGVPKLGWTSIQPEYDPHKYNSFSVNAGDQVYEITESVNARLSRLAGEDGLVRGVPPILSAFSVVDATVSSRAVLAFHDRLAREDGHAVVIFDVDRTHATDDFLHTTDLELLDALPPRDARAYDLTVVANASEDSDELADWDDAPGRDGAHAEPLGFAWPRGVYSLAHVAIPFPPTDPIYGLAPFGDPDMPSLGNLQLRGERGLFVVDGDSRMRLRSNPFFDYLATRVMSAAEATRR